MQNKQFCFPFGNPNVLGGGSSRLEQNQNFDFFAGSPKGGGKIINRLAKLRRPNHAFMVGGFFGGVLKAIISMCSSGWSSWSLSSSCCPGASWTTRPCSPPSRCSTSRCTLVSTPLEGDRQNDADDNDHEYYLDYYWWLKIRVILRKFFFSFL